MARPQVKAEQQPGAFAGRGMGRGFSSRGGRGGRAGYDHYAYPQGQYNTGYGGGGYGYDASGGYGYGDYPGGYQQYGAGMQMVPMMLPSGQVCLFCHWIASWLGIQKSNAGTVMTQGLLGFNLPVLAEVSFGFGFDQYATHVSYGIIHGKSCMGQRPCACQPW